MIIFLWQYFTKNQRPKKCSLNKYLKKQKDVSRKRSVAIFIINKSWDENNESHWYIFSPKIEDIAFKNISRKVMGFHRFKVFWHHLWENQPPKDRSVLFEFNPYFLYDSSEPWSIFQTLNFSKTHLLILTHHVCRCT